MQRPTLSLVLPIFNEEPVIPELHRRLHEFLAAVGVSWEVVFIDDGSKDRSFELLRALSESEPRYKLIRLSRNFGHQVAITAGVDFAEGEAVVVMDADLQDPPEVVSSMLAKWREGFDVVYGVRAKRENESIFKRLTAAAFYRILRAMVGVAIPVDAGDFRLMGRPVVLTLRALRESNRFVRGMVAWVGFRQTAVEYVRPGRFAGETHYPLRKMIRFAIDGITSFSIIPLRLATFLGLAAGFVGITTACWAFYEWLLHGSVVAGWTTLMVAISLAASAQLLMIGILGEYVGRIYEEVKRRPLYVVSEGMHLESAPAAATLAGVRHLPAAPSPPSPPSAPSLPSAPSVPAPAARASTSALGDA
jgi:dolichol-phosphate mannosyltransferase